MARYVQATYEQAQAWDRMAELGELEAVPAEMPEVGGFEYLVLPGDVLDRYRFGGYDAYDTETGVTDTLMLVSGELPRHVRGLLVSHLIMHKTIPDDGTPHLCSKHDRSIQSVIAETEPTLIEPFYTEAESMYREGYAAASSNPHALPLAVERYRKALSNSHIKGELSHSAADVRQRLADAGLVLPDGEQSLNGMDKRTGNRTFISLQTEAGNRHKCKNCSHTIIKGSERITTSTQQSVDGYDHHHYHPGCFTHVELGAFSDLHQTD